MGTPESVSRVAIVTGSGKKRVGWYVADALAAQDYSVVVHYHTSAAEAAETVARLRTRGVEVIALRADLSNGDDAEELIRATLAHFGRIDVLVNCAAVWKAIRLETITENDLLENFRVNVLGTFACARAAGLAMVRQPYGGSIINFSDWAESRPYLDFAAYFATKGAIPALTRCLAVELGTRNPKVRVNCIVPGPVLFQPDLPDAEKRHATEATLTKSAGHPESIARAVLFLVSDDFATGSCLRVDGGRTVYALGH